jgi:hypothetical protein
VIRLKTAGGAVIASRRQGQLCDVTCWRARVPRCPDHAQSDNRPCGRRDASTDQGRVDSVTFTGISSLAMSRPIDRELAALHYIADDLRESMAARGHRVGQALAADPAFGSRSKSSLVRDMVIDSLTVATASCADADFRPVNGAGRELRFYLNTDRRYRVRRGRRDERGDVVVMVNAESALAVDDDQYGLLPAENWAFVWIANDDCLIDEVLAAEVRGVTNGKPGRVVFGDVIPLGGSARPAARFSARTDDLDEYLDEYLNDEDDGDQIGEQPA